MRRRSNPSQLALQHREQALRGREIALIQRERALDAVADSLKALQDRIAMIQAANAQLVQATFQAQTMVEREKKLKEALDFMAHHDVLTGLPNRSLLLKQLRNAMGRAQDADIQVAVLFIDLDDFKGINDHFGHAIGDQLLQAVAQRLLACIRRSDFVCRLGGDEFVAVLTQIEHSEDAQRTAQKLLDSLVQSYSIDGNDLAVSASIGISLYPGDALEAEALIKAADTAVYTAKKLGRKRFAWFRAGGGASTEH